MIDKRGITEILAILQTAYPGFYRGMTQQQLEDARKLWLLHFEAQDMNVLGTAVNRLIATRKETWPPTIGEVNDMISEVTGRKDLTAQDAWSIVRKAINNGIYGSRQEWERFPESVRAAVTPDQIRSWAMDDHFNEGVASSGFMRSYREVRERIQRDRMIPENVKDLIRQAGSPKLEEK